jgi:histidinol-phosphate aminotransferase
VTARLRPVLHQVPVYVPGRRPAPGQASARLASNETSFGPLPGVAEAVARAAADAHRYPDPTATALVEALAARHGVPAAGVAVGCGSVALVQQLVQITCDQGDEVLFAWRSFEAYPVMARIGGAVPVQVPLTAAAEHDLEAMAAAVTKRTRLVLLCSPNNPTGPALRHDAVTAFLDRIPPDVVMVLDEAYAEFVTDPAAVDGRRLLAAHPNVLVLRTFSKAYGLAGLRAGFALGAPEVVAALRQVAVPFAVSTPAQAAAMASLRADDELARRVAIVVAQRERVVSAARALGVDVPDAQGNFFWLPAGDSAAEVAASLENYGVLSRPFAGHGVRVTVTDEPETGILLRALEATYAGGRPRRTT